MGPPSRVWRIIQVDELTGGETGKHRIQEGLSEAEKAAQQSKNAVLQKIHEADLKVEKKAAEAKGGLMSWFGFK